MSIQMLAISILGIVAGLKPAPLEVCAVFNPDRVFKSAITSSTFSYLSLRSLASALATICSRNSGRSGRNAETTSGVSFKNVDKTLPQIADELGVMQLSLAPC